MTITFHTEAEFFDGIENMAKRGLQFKADHRTYTITLTGGY